MEALRLSLVPPSLDQVFVGDVDRSRPDAARYVFLLGVNDGACPHVPEKTVFFPKKSGGLERLGANGPESAALADEQFLTYMVLTRASQGLRVSYSLADEDGRALVPSLLVTHLKELFPSLQENCSRLNRSLQKMKSKRTRKKRSIFCSIYLIPEEPFPILLHKARPLEKEKKSPFLVGSLQLVCPG